MKYLTHLILASITIGYAYAQAALVKHDWNVTLKIVDEAGQPVANAKAGVGYYSKSQPASIDGLTDTNGIFTASHYAYFGILGFAVEKSGYYTTRETYDLGFTYDAVKWNPLQTIILRKIGKPIAMYARKVQVEIPEIDNPIGFDLTVADWVAPHGKGIQSDFIFQVQRRWISRNDFDSSVKITFLHHGDGLVPVSIPLNQGSKLRMPAIAPANGYIDELSKNLSHTSESGWKKNEADDQNYYFRVRTAIDDRSNIVSAHYGKIYGDFGLDPINSKTALIIFTYYLNPMLNDRNVEFDPKRNLMKKLTPLEAVTGP